MTPRTLKIRGHVYKVQQVNQKVLGDYMADVDNDLNVIRIYNKASQPQKVELLLHETLHAMLSGCNLDREEEIVSILGEALTSFLWDNPAFIKHALATLNP